MVQCAIPSERVKPGGAGPAAKVRHLKRLSITNRICSISYMKRQTDDFLERCVERIRELPFVDDARLLRETGERAGSLDGRLRVVTPDATRELDVEVKRTHLTRTIVDGMLAQAVLRGPRAWILFAPHVGRPLARHLDEQGANFVDLAGNCRLQIGRRHVAKVEGRPPERRPQHGRGMGAPGQQIVFALLVRPALLNEPLRTLAGAAGVATATAAARVARLREEGLVHGTDQGNRLTAPRRLLDLWLKGYETLVRPKLLIGRYRAQQTDPQALERLIEETLGGKAVWAFGGGAAAHRLTGYYRGPETVVHVQQADFDVAKRLRVLRADDGPLILLRAPGPIAFEGVRPRTVAPLLAYTELLYAGDKRAREAAGEIQRRYLGAIS